ncbi:putative AC transposase [Orchesella cincta]|uniref:Putative AC transposase n=1 Tax=Orchesella cincta TaxID=48709 RepID=A0A1D2M2X0_ORCCI|nr:putative AC transposase [Orchesella cincta]
MSRDALTKRVSELHSTTVNQITKNLNEASYICLTADAWSAHSKAFLGVTSHWITADLKRESAVLACSRFKGTHSFDRIAQELNKIIAKFSISKEKIVSIVTDNGSNFVKAFKEFGISTEEPTKGAPDSEDEENDEEWTEEDGEKVSSESHLMEPQ